MKELSTIKTMSSREIAETTGKPHNDVLKAIRKMEPAWAKVNGGNFSLVEYTDAKGEKRPEYQLSKTKIIKAMLTAAALYLAFQIIMGLIH